MEQPQELKLLIKYMDPFTQNETPMLSTLNHDNPLEDEIEKLCQTFQISPSKNFALKLADKNEKEEKFITEENRWEIKPGAILWLRLSPKQEFQRFFNVLEVGSIIEKNEALKSLKQLSSDAVFVKEYAENKNIITIIQNLIIKPKCNGDLFKNSLILFEELTYYDFFDWSMVSEDFVTRIINVIKDRMAASTEIMNKIIALSILEKVIENCDVHWIHIQNNIRVEDLFNMLQTERSNNSIKNMIAVIKAMFMKSTLDEKKFLSTYFLTDHYRAIINKIYENIDENSEIMCELSVLQSLALWHIKGRMNSVMQPNDVADANYYFSHMWKIAFGSEEIQLERLMFQNLSNPIDDFSKPPGKLAMDCIMHILRQNRYKVEYFKLMTYNQNMPEDMRFPFGRACIKLVEMLCNILNIGGMNEDHKTFQPMLFSRNDPFEELFSISLFQFYRLWKDMKAKQNDFEKVLKTVKGLIDYNLCEKHNLFGTFEEKLSNMDFKMLKKLKRSSRSYKNEQPNITAMSNAITQLKERRLNGEVNALIWENTVQFLQNGTKFDLYKKGNHQNNRFCFAQLSKNEDFIHYIQFRENEDGSKEEVVDNAISVRDIKQLLTGDDCPHYKDFKRKSNEEFFSIGYDHEQKQMCLDFVTTDSMIFSYWTDGINKLLGLNMQSKYYKEEFDLLMDLELMIQLLELDDIDEKFVSTIPSIPGPPDNYDFYNK